MRIISSTFNSIAAVFDAVNAAADLASDTASKGLASLRNENLADKIIEKEDLSKRIDAKKLEIDREFERISKERSKLEESPFYKQGQIRKIKGMIEIEEFKRMKEKSPEEKIAALQELLSKLESKPATSVEDVAVINK